MTTVNSTSDDDLLLAVRFVLNECQQTELAMFEARLADDPAAQTALVEAVQIVALLQATPSCEAFARESHLQAASVSRKTSAPSRRSWKIAALVAAGLLVAVVLNWPTPLSPQVHHTVSTPGAATPSDIAPSVTLFTITNADEFPALAQAWTALDPDQITSNESDPIDDAPGDIASDVPDWLLTAVLVEAQQGAAEQGATGENDPGLEEDIQL